MQHLSNNLRFGLLIVALVLLLGLDLSCGSVWMNIFRPMYPEILLQLRLPKALTAILAGAALSVSGLMMQTLFRNPLAGPYILGISSGASLGVALVTMLAGWLGVSAAGGVVPAAIVGSLLVLLLVLAVARRVENNTSMLIIGLMFGSIAGALVNLIQNFANPEALKLFVVWTFGSLSAVGWREMAVLGPTLVLGLLLSMALIKPLNGLLLGENYARGLGINVRLVRVFLVVATGALAGATTAYCGPIAFIGVAVPHLARGLFATSNHRVVLPASVLLGADILLLCDILSGLTTYPLPISTVSALFGAPVIIWIIMRKKS